MKILIYTFLLITPLFFFSCTQPPDYPDEPVIEFFGLSKNTMPQGFSEQTDFLWLTVSFTDGDGDIGHPNGSIEQNVFLTDLRTNLQNVKFTIPTVPDQGIGNGISGKINVKVPTTCCVYMGNSICGQSIPDFPVDTLLYRVQIQDRAGNLSNEVVSEPIYLLCQ